MTGTDGWPAGWREQRQRQVLLAWAEAMEAACRMMCQRRGVAPIDNTCALTSEQNELAWEANAVLSAGVAALARASDREGLEWPEILEMALQESDESDRHRVTAMAPMPAPRPG